MSHEFSTIADLSPNAIKGINSFLTFSPHDYFGDNEIEYLAKKSNLYPFMRGTLLTDEQMLQLGLIQADYSEKFIQDELKAFMETIVKDDYSANAYQEVINNELYRIKSQICRYGLVLISKHHTSEVLLLCDDQFPICVKTISRKSD